MCFLSKQLFAILTFFGLCLILVSGSNAQSLLEDDNLNFMGYKPSFDYKTFDEGVEKQVLGPDDLEGYLDRAVDYIQNDELVLAIKDLNYVISHYDEYGGAFFYRGLCYKGMYKMDSAISDFNKAISLKTFEYYGPSHLELGLIEIDFYRNYEKAKEHFEFAYELNPDDYQVNYALSYWHLKKRDLPNALKHIKKCVEIEPEIKGSYYLLAQIRLRQGMLAKARAALDMLLELYPDDKEAMILKSTLYPYQNQLKKGLEILEGILIEEPDHEQALFVAGLLYLEDKEIAKGFKYLAKGLNQSEVSKEEFGISDSRDRELKLIYTIKYVSGEIDSYSKAMQKLAYTYLQNSDTHFASYYPIKEYEKLYANEIYIPTGIYLLHSIIAEKNTDKRFWGKDNLRIIERDTSMYHVYRSLGKYYYKIDDFQEAEKYYTKMLYLDREIADGYKLRGLNRAKHNQFIKSIQDFNIYLSYNKLNPDILEERAYSYMKLGYINEAEEDYQSVIEVSARKVRGKSVVNLASIKLHKGDTIGAIEVFDQAISSLVSKTVSSDLKLPLYKAYNYRGNIKLQFGQMKEAVEDFSSAIKSDKYFDLAYFNRGVANYRLGNYALAKQDFTKWLEIHANDPDGLLWRGKSEIALNELPEAKNDLTKAQELGIEEAKSLLAEIGK